MVRLNLASTPVKDKLVPLVKEVAKEWVRTIYRDQPIKVPFAGALTGTTLALTYCK